MRIYFKIETTNKIVPFDHQHLLTGIIHKWIGWNNEHGNVSLYSFHGLKEEKEQEQDYVFEKETSFFFSSYKLDLIKNGCWDKNDPSLLMGLSYLKL